MIARKQLDVRLRDVGYGLLACTGIAPRPPATDRADRSLLCARDDAVVCLSVRSAFDLLLGELAWPAGDEVLVSAITIPDMSRILREHGLKPVPIDLEPATLAMDEAALERAVTPRTRAVLVAHLFGARLPLERVIAWAHGRGLLVIEDCAQAWVADGFAGHAGSDAVFFSFGTIKTATAFGGGVMLVPDAVLRERLERRHAQWPVQKTGSYFRRLLKFGVFTLVQGSLAYGALFRLVRLLGREPDATITQLGRGFAGENFFFRLRHRPCEALRRMLARRIATYDVARVQRRADVGARMLAALRAVQPLGAKGLHHTHWLFPLRVGNASALQATLWRAGFDATRASSSLHALPDEAHATAPAAQAAMREVLYVPVYAGMGDRKLSELAALLNEHAEPSGHG